MDSVVDALKILFVFISTILIIQFCINTILTAFGIHDVTFLQTLCGIILIGFTVYYVSISWHKGK